MTQSSLNPVQIDDFLALDLPPRELLLEPWLTAQSLNLLTAYRGTGKTFVALGLSYAVASGGAFLRWRAPKPAKVLFVDGEMPATELQNRLRMIETASETKADPRNFRIITPDLADGSLPDISTAEGQERLDACIRDAQLIVVDNLSALARTGAENDAESWTMVAEWGLRMRRQKRSVLFLHHAGKGGQQRGTSKREDLLDTSVMLERPTGYLTSDGARFRWTWSKARGLYGEAAAPLDVRLESVPGGTAWTWSPVGDEIGEMIEQLRAEGTPVRKIANTLGVSKSAVQRHVERTRIEAEKYRNASRGG